MTRLALLVHVLAVVFWVGGMAFTHFALRPALAALSEPAHRFMLVGAVLARFFPGVSAAIVLIIASGAYLLAIDGATAARPAIHAMVALGGVMIAVFAYIRARPYPVLQRAITIQGWAEAGTALGTIRKLVAFNLLVGTIVIVVIVLGR